MLSSLTAFTGGAEQYHADALGGFTVPWMTGKVFVEAPDESHIRRLAQSWVKNATITHIPTEDGVKYFSPPQETPQAMTWVRMGPRSLYAGDLFLVASSRPDVDDIKIMGAPRISYDMGDDPKKPKFRQDAAKFDGAF